LRHSGPVILTGRSAGKSFAFAITASPN
jgi:hypothetical protein